MRTRITPRWFLALIQVCMDSQIAQRQHYHPKTMLLCLKDLHLLRDLLLQDQGVGKPVHPFHRHHTLLQAMTHLEAKLLIQVVEALQILQNLIPGMIRYIIAYSIAGRGYMLNIGKYPDFLI